MLDTPYVGTLRAKEEPVAMNIWIRVVAGLDGFLIQVLVLDVAIHTFLLPRVANVRPSRFASKAVG